MAWDWKHTILAGLAVLSVAGAGLAFHSWLASHDALLRAEATVRQQQRTLTQDAQASRRIADQQKRRDAQAAREIAALRVRAAKQKTPAQIAAWLPKQIPAPMPIKIRIPKPTPNKPAPAAVATIPQLDLGAMRDFVSTCQQCSMRLGTVQQDLAAKQRQLTLARKELSAALKERDVALQAAKGGGFWRRLGAAMKWFAIGAGTGAAMVCGTGHCR